MEVTWERKGQGRECHILAKFSLHFYVINYNLCLAGQVILLQIFGVLGQNWPSDKDTREISCQSRTNRWWFGGELSEDYNAVSPPGFKYLCDCQALHRLTPHLARDSERVSLNSKWSRRWPWPCGLPVSTSPEPELLRFMIIPAVCGTGDGTHGLAILNKHSSNWTTLRVPLYSISLGRKTVITCFKTYLKLTEGSIR